MIPRAVLAARGGGGAAGGAGAKSLARSLHTFKLAFQSCRYMASRAENIHVFPHRRHKKINKTLALLVELAFQS